MKKILLSLLILSPTLFIGQNIKKEKVKSSFLTYPKIDMNGMDPATLKAEFCAGNIKSVSQTVKKGSNACKAKGGKAQIIEIFYYQLGVMNPESYLRISDNNGNVKYSKQTSWVKSGTIDYGKKKCYWAEPILKSAFEKERESFMASSQKAAAKRAMADAKIFLDGALSFTYNPEEIEVYYVKGKDHSYADLEKAADLASEGYTGLKGNYTDANGQAKLKEAVAIWEKAMSESNPDSKDSRINKKVTFHVAENLARAYMYLLDYDKAQKTIKSALDLQKNVSNNGKVRREYLLADISEYKKGYNLNKAIPYSKALVKIPFTLKPMSELTKFKEDNQKHGVTVAAGNAAANQEEYDAGVASGEINKYQKFVVDVTGGKMLTLPDLAAKIAKTEGGEKLDVFPEEITDLKGITALTLRGNNLKTIPPSIAKMTSLKKLVLTNNQLKSLPAEIGELKELKSLVIKGNSISAADVAKIQGMLPNCKIKQ